MDLVTEDSYEKRYSQSTITTALVKEKELKTRTNTKNPKKVLNKQQCQYEKTIAKEKRNVVKATRWDILQEYATPIPKTQEKE